MLCSINKFAFERKEREGQLQDIISEQENKSGDIQEGRSLKGKQARQTDRDETEIGMERWDRERGREREREDN